MNYWLDCEKNIEYQIIYIFYVLMILNHIEFYLNSRGREKEREREKEKNSYSFVEMCEEKILKREVNYKFLFCFSFFSCIFSFGVFFPFFPSFSICFVFIPFFFFVLNTNFCIVSTVNCLSEFFHPRYLFTFTFLHFFFLFTIQICIVFYLLFFIFN